MNGQVKCDVCGAVVNEPDGYQLTTIQVVGSPGFWQNYYERHADEFTEMGVTSYEAFSCAGDVRLATVERFVQDSTSWLVCEQCIHLFDVDQEQVRTYAQQWWESGRTFTPPGTGPASLSDVQMGDAVETITPEKLISGEGTVEEVEPPLAEAQPEVRSEIEGAEVVEAGGVSEAAETLEAISVPPTEAPTPKKRSGRGCVLLIAAAALAALLLVGAVIAYYSIGMSTYNRAVEAHNSCDAATALVHYDTVTRFYPAFLGFPQQAAVNLQECALYFAGSQAQENGDYQTASECYNRLWTEYPTTPFNPLLVEELPEVLYAYADELARSGDYAAAITHYQFVAERHPASEWAAEAPAAISQTYYDWATQLREDGEYEQAIATYQTLINEYPDAAVSQEAKAARAGTYGDWAAQLREQKEYAAAIEKYQAVLQEYAGTPTGTRTEAMLAETYGEWADQLREEEDYGAAIEKYEAVLSEYPDAPMARQAKTGAAETYAEWAAQLQKVGKLEDAVEKYETLLSKYADTPAATQAKSAVAETYVEWADQLQEVGDYGRAATSYQIVLDQYPDTPAAARAKEAAAATYAAWAGQLAEAGKYEEAVEKYKVVLDEYPDAPAAAEAQEAVPAIYGEWAAELRAAGDYGKAIEKYQALLSEYPDTPAAAGAEEAAAETYYEWGSDLHKNGRYSEAIEKYKAAVSDFPGTKAAGTAQVATGRAYNDWGSSLHSQQKYIAAMDKFTMAKQSTGDPEVVAAADEGYNAALWDLSQDTTGEGKQVMDEALPDVCAGKAAASPAVGLSKDESGKALFGGWEFTLPNDLKAVKPAHFRYAVCLSKGNNEVERCPYGLYGLTHTHTLVRQQQWWQVRVRDTSTAQVVAEKTFYGSWPAECPQTRSFGSTTEYLSGGSPSSDEVVNWLKDVIH
jgi:tetratricopeptide (TPR) repeat protein